MKEKGTQLVTGQGRQTVGTNAESGTKQNISWLKTEPFNNRYQNNCLLCNGLQLTETKITILKFFVPHL